MKAWIKGGLIGIVIGALIEIVLAGVVWLSSPLPLLVMRYSTPPEVALENIVKFFIPVILGAILGAIVWHIKQRKEASNVK